ncbi:hypothetical protein [Ramlibacter sp. AN1133]|uniref:hypothetical protein n=1 Tax=Ramlibacter sp. AN1133 TaxID=3133429 RepID=UPI0030C50278
MYRKLKHELHLPAAEPGSPEVLVDIADNLCEGLEQFAFARYFCDRLQYQPVAYVPGFTPRRQLLYRALGRRAAFLVSRGYRMARELGMGHGLDAALVDSRIRRTAARDTRVFFATACTKEEVLKYQLLGVKIGVSIYDSYLREALEPTVDTASPLFRRIVFEAFITLRCVAEYFEHHHVKMVVLGHCVYNNWQILSDYARLRGAQVFVTYNSRSIPLHDVNGNRGLQTTDHSRYKQEFGALPEAVRARGRKEGMELLRRRVGGEIDPGISYMASSAYAGDATAVRVAVAPDKKPVVMMLHSFFDSPHVYAAMVFPDFLEWARETLEACRSPEFQARLEILIKPHPNRFPAEDAVIQQILTEYPFAKLLPAETSNNAIVSMRPACILTVYGSVAAEFSYFGVPVITCGDNPTSSFGFTFEARSKDEYLNFLVNADMLRVTPERVAEVGDFMFMHYLHKAPELPGPYPFERYAPHAKKKNSERVGDFRFAEFKQLVDAKLDLLGLSTTFQGPQGAEMRASGTPGA